MQSTVRAGRPKVTTTYHMITLDHWPITWSLHATDLSHDHFRPLTYHMITLGYWPITWSL